MRQSFLILFLLALFFSCEDDTDDQNPLVFISTPAENQTYSVLDKINIQASIQDNEMIEQVNISVYKSSSRTLAGNAITLFPNTNSYQLNFDYEFADTLIPSGNYYFRVSASDGKNEASDFRTFNLVGIPKRLVDLVYAEEVNGYTDVMARNNQGNTRTLFSFLGSCMEMGIDQKNQMLWLVDSTSRLMAYDLTAQNLVFDQQINNPGFSPLFTDLEVFDGKAYVATQAGDVNAYNANLTDVFTYQSDLNKYVRKITPDSKYILVEELTRGSNIMEVKSIFRSTGASIASSPFNELVLGFSNRNDDPSKIMSANDSVFFLYEYNASLGLKNKVYERDLNNTISAISKPNEQWVIEGANSLYFFDQNANFLKELTSRNGKATMEFSELADEVYIATGNQINSYSLPLGNQSFNYTSSNTISGMALRYNY